MNFALFVMLTAVVLIRPEELVPNDANLRLYLLTIGGCVLTTIGPLIDRLRSPELARQPITVCVLGVWAAGVLSQLARGQFSEAMDFTEHFVKVVLFYLLLVSILDTPGRLRAFLGWLVAFVVVLTTLALLQFHGVIDVAAIRTLEDTHFDPVLGEDVKFERLVSSGIYHDPNDLCLILVTGSLCALYRAVTAGGLVGRVLWLAPIVLFGYAVVLTRSRGGLLGLGLAALTWGCGYYGWKRMLPLILPLIPVAAMAGGRQTNINLKEGDTAFGRVMLWYEGFEAMKRNPVTGIGVGQYPQETGYVAHNSFVHAFVETGLVGGCCFLGAFFLSATQLHRAGPSPDPTLRVLRPFLQAIIVGYVGGVFSVSRNYVVPTYLLLGLAAAYLRLAYPAPPVRLRFDSRMATRLLVVGVVGLVVLYVLTQLLVRAAG